MTKPEIVLFDLGNVLVHIDTEAFLRTLNRNSQEEKSRFKRGIVEIVGRYERGDVTTESYLSDLHELLNEGDRFSNRISKQGKNESQGIPSGFGVRPHGEIDKDAIRRAMLNVIGKPIEGMEDVVRRVAASARVGLLSNTNPLHYAHCTKHLPALKLIPHHYLSYQLKSLKPEREIFEKVLLNLQVAPEAVLFIDDLAENIQGASEIGFIGVRFENATSLREILKELGFS